MPEGLIGHLPASSRVLTGAKSLDVSIVDGNGAQVTNFGGLGGTSSSFGSPFPSSGTAIGFKDSSGTNMAAGNLDASGYLKVNVAAGGAAGQSPTTPTLVTPIAADGSNHTALSADSNRLAACFSNNSAAPFRLKAGTTAAANSYSRTLLPGEEKSMIDLFGSNYQGRVDAISVGVDATTDAGLYVTYLTA